MALLPRRDEGRVFTDAAIRCPTCGRRLRRSHPVCPLHGPLDLDGADPESVVCPVAPQFVGYRTLGLIARGGFGTVFEAQALDAGPGHPRVAIKLARKDRSDAADCLLHETHVLAEVGPPHVPTLHGVGRLDDGTPYLVMEYIAAPPLAKRLIASEGPISIVEACRSAVAILEALEAVHARGIVHRDLTPENVMADGDRMTLVDFGLSAERSEGAAEGFAGTAEYMSPEQCEGRADIDPRTDIYAMGVILYELVAGRPPFWGSRTVVRECHLSRRPPRLSALMLETSIPQSLDDLGLLCLAKDRDERIGSAGALREALLAVCREITDGVPAPPLGNWQQGRTSRVPEQVPSSHPSAPAVSTERPRAPVMTPALGTILETNHNERMTVGLLFFEAEVDRIAVQARVAALGGQLAHGAGSRYVAAYGQETRENPARRALLAAEHLVREGLCTRVRLDLAPVFVQTRRNGGKRFVSPLFTRTDRFPAPGDPLGISLTEAAAAVLPDSGVSTLTPSEPMLAVPITGVKGLHQAADVRTPPLFGRDALLTSLVESAGQTVALGDPTVITVIGDTGVGKSHLYTVLLDRLRAEGFPAEVFPLRAREPSLGDVDHTLAELFTRILDLPAARPADGGSAILRSHFGDGPRDLAPAVGLAVGWIGADAAQDPMGRAIKRLEVAPGALRSALTLAAGEALRCRALRQPMLIVVDDAHVAGDVVLAALEYAARAEARVPVWICALGRPSLGRDRGTWGERAARRDVLRLGPLEAEAAEALCRHLLLPAESIPEAAVQRLVERAKAIPLLLVELVRGLKRDGIVRRSPKGESWYLATDELDRLPDLPLVEWLARGEVDALAPALQGHAQLLALLGDRVAATDLTGILSRLEGDPALPLDAKISTRRLLAAGLVVHDRDGLLNFPSGLVREAIARATPEEFRLRVHVAAMDHFQDSAPELGEERRLSQLAAHAAEAGDGATASRAYLDLADRARARHAYTKAEGLYSRGLEQIGTSDPTRRGSAHRGRGLMRYRIGRYHDAIVDFAHAREIAIADGDVVTQVEILLDEATALDWMDDFRASKARVEQARTLMVSASSPLLEARLLLGRGRSSHRASRNEDAADFLARAIERAASLGEEGYESLVVALMLQSFTLAGLGKLDEARLASNRAVALCDSHGDRLHLGGALNARGMLWGYLADKDRMVADMNRALSVARELGQRTLELMVEFNAGEYLLLMDDAEAATPHIQRAVALDRLISGDPGRPVVALLEARLALHHGFHDAARAIALRVRDQQEALLAPSDDVLCTMLDLATRNADDADWERLEARSEEYSAGQERIEVIEMRGVVATRRGDIGDGRRHLARALAFAAMIPNAMDTRLQRRAKELGLSTA